MVFRQLLIFIGDCEHTQTVFFGNDYECTQGKYFILNMIYSICKKRIQTMDHLRKVLRDTGAYVNWYK